MIFLIGSAEDTNGCVAPMVISAMHDDNLCCPGCTKLLDDSLLLDLVDVAVVNIEGGILRHEHVLQNVMQLSLINCHHLHVLLQSLLVLLQLLYHIL